MPADQGLQLNTLAFIIGIASFIGAIAGAALSNLVNARLARHERMEARRKEHIDYLREKLSQLIELMGKIHYQMTPSESDFQFNRAYGILASIPDENIRSQAQTVFSHLPTDQRIANLGNCIKLLGDLINKRMSAK